MKANPISIARWMMLAGAAGFLVLLALTSWALRDQIYQTFQDPGEPFQTYTPPRGANYASDEAWFAQFRETDEAVNKLACPVDEFLQLVQEFIFIAASILQRETDG